MNPSRLRSALLLVIWFLSPQPAGNACSVVMGYVRPTNYELVKDAEAIVLANAVEFQKKGALGKGKSLGIFQFKVLERIKGECKDERIAVEGDDNLRSWGDPNDFNFTKSDHGPCNPTDYELKGNYVLFLQNWKGRWLVGGPPFTRVNVLVEGTNAPWTQAIRRYAAIASLNDYEKEKVALRELRSRALAGEVGCPAALVQDIDVHFSKPTPAKSFSDLRALYDRATDAQTREGVLWACARGEKQEAKGLFQSLLSGDEWTKYLHPVCSYVANVKLSGFNETFVSALRTNSNEHQRRMLLAALTESAQAPEQPQMQKVLESVHENETSVVAKWFVDHPSPEAIKYLTKVAGKDYDKHFEVTLILAAMGDTYVVNWAQESAKRPGKEDWLFYYVFAQSPLPAADALARSVIARGDSEALVSLVQGYGDSRRSDRLDRIQEVMALKTKSRKLVFWLRRVLDNWAYDGNKQAASLLDRLPIVDDE